MESHHSVTNNRYLTQIWDLYAEYYHPSARRGNGNDIYTDPIYTDVLFPHSIISQAQHLMGRWEESFYISGKGRKKLSLMRAGDLVLGMSAFKARWTNDRMISETPQPLLSLLMRRVVWHEMDRYFYKRFWCTAAMIFSWHRLISIWGPLSFARSAGMFVS